METIERKEEYFKLDPESGSVSLSMLSAMHPAIVYMIAWTNLWCIQNNIEPVWTSWVRTPEQNRALGATNVHEYRAADLSLKDVYGWDNSLRDAYEIDIIKAFGSFGALVDVDGELVSRPIVRHDVGHGDHFHLQVRP